MRRKELSSQNTRPSTLLPQLLSIEEVKGVLGVGDTKITELIEKDGLPVFTLGGRGRERRIDRDDFSAWLQKQKQKEAAISF